MLKDCKGIIFDLDGTLVDSLGIWTKIDREYLERYGYEFTEEVAKNFKNKGFGEIADYLTENFNIPRTREEMMQDWDDMSFSEFKYRVNLIEGAKEFLHQLKKRKVKLAIGTSNTRQNVHAVLKRHDILHLFDAIVTEEDVENDKPAPDIYLEALHRLRVHPTEAFVFEDMIVGIRAAKAAGVRVCAIESDENRLLRLEREIMVEHSMEDYRNTAVLLSV